MRLDPADWRDIDVRVQCLDNEYQASEAAFKCLDEVRNIRKESTKDSPEREKDFAHLEIEYSLTGNFAAKQMMTGFGLINVSTPEARVAEFKADLEKQRSPGVISYTMNTVKDWLGF